MSDVTLRKMPVSDTRSRKDLEFNVIQAIQGVPLSSRCPCSILSERDLLFNMVLAAQQPTVPFELRKMPVSDTRSRKELMFNFIEATLGEPLNKPCACANFSEKELVYNMVLAAQDDAVLGGGALAKPCVCTTLSEKDLLYNLVIAAQQEGGNPPVNTVPPSISGGVAEVTDFNFTGINGNSLVSEGGTGVGLYVAYSDETGRIVVWFRTDAETEPSVPGADFYERCDVIAGVDGDTDVATKFNAIVGGSVTEATVTFTDPDPGPREDAVAGTSGATVTVTTQGGFPVGATLTCDDGTWTGADTITRQWQHDGGTGTWVNISGQTAATYNVQAIYATEDIRCNVTAENSNGETSEPSNELGPVSILLWLDASQLVGFSNGDPIPSAPNLGGGSAWTQATGALQPTFLSVWKNGLPAFEVDGTQFLSGTIQSPTAGYTIFAVAERTGPLTGGVIDFNRADAFGTYLEAGSTKWCLNHRNVEALKSPAIEDVPYFLAATWDGSDTQAFVDGVGGSVQANALTLPSGTLDGTLGRLHDLFFLTGRVGEVRIFSPPLDATNFSQIRDLLSDKWGF